MSTENNPEDSEKTNLPEKKNYGMQKEEWQILDFLFDNPRALILRQIAAAIQLSESHMHHHINSLLSYGLIIRGDSWQIAGDFGYDPVGYELTPTGRTAVVARRAA